MIKLTVISMGKLKEKYFRDLQEEYLKRLSRYCNIEIFEIEPVRLSDNPADSEVSSALEREADLILKKLPERAFVSALCVEGRELSSEQLAEKMDALQSGGQPMCFIIGSSYGLAERIKQRADLRLSFSKMTFPHRLFRVMLLEQIYRGFKINEGSAYHK